MTGRLRLGGVVVALLCLTACAVGPTHPALRDAALPDQLPVHAFVANLDSNGNYSVSPDGRKLAWIGVAGFGPALMVRSIGRDGTVIFKHLAGYAWAQDSRRVFFLLDAGGDENHHVLMLDTEQPDAPAVDLTPHAGIRASIKAVLRSDPNRILVLHNQRDPQVFDLYAIDLRSGQQTLVAQNPGDVVDFIVDADGQLLARIRQAAGVFTLEAARQGSERFEPLVSWSPPEEEFRVLEATGDGQGLYVLSNRHRDRIGLARLDLRSGEETALHDDPDGDVADVRISATSHLPLLAVSHPDYPRLQIFDAALRAELDALFDSPPRALHVVSIDNRERRLVLLAENDGDSRFYLVDRDNHSKSLIGTAKNARHAAQLSSPRPVLLQSRDGLPLVLLVHGGPWARDTWNNNMGLEQFLANRGYAVLQINYRGSVGYGRAFTEAAIHQLGGGGKMHDDLMDGVQWAVDQGFADPAHVAIVGASWGGYASLVGLSFTPTAFSCGIDIAGPSNLPALIEQAPVYWSPLIQRLHRYLGDPADPAQRQSLLAQSPLSHADAVQRPLLIVQGANDPRVRRNQADDMVAALRQAGKPVDYLLLPGEGHGGSDWRNNLRVYRRIEDFLSVCLGGRSSGFDLYEWPARLF